MTSRTGYGLWLVLCILLAFALRTYRLDLQSLWYDEGVTAEIVRWDWGALIRWTAQDIQPPLYYLVVSGWGKLLQALAPTVEAIQTPIPQRWGGAWSEWSLRYPSVLMGCLTVPILAALATGLSGKRLAGAIAGLLTALHPLFFYYSQEARMYALLTVLGITAGYILLCRLNRPSRPNSDSPTLNLTPPSNRPPLRILYILTATAAVYTHYFAFFLLGTLALLFLIRQFLFTTTHSSSLNLSAPHSCPSNPQTPTPSPQQPSTIYPFLLSHLTIGLLYLPWFATLIFQLREDTSYWQGEFKVEEALLNVLISLIGGETVVESVGQWLLIPLTLLTGVSILALLWPADHESPITNHESPPSSIYLLLTSLLWWILPTCAILGVALFIPKFNPRYVMLGLPGLILLWSAGLAKMGAGIQSILAIEPLGKLDTFDTPRHFWRYVIDRLLPGFALLLLCMLLAVFVYADRNYFVDPEFTKTQWRPLARFVSKRAKPGELVLLSSGHTWPVWNYYAPGVPAVGLPEMRILDVNNVLDYRLAADSMGKLLAHTERPWLVTWQNEVVDPMAVVPLLLERAAVESPRESNYWDVDVRRFKELDRAKFTPRLGQEVMANFGNQLVLLGYEIHETGELLLYWRRHPAYQPPIGDLDLRLAGQLRTVDALLFATFEDQPLTLHEWPTTRWNVEQIVVSRIPASHWTGSGALPGAYELRVSLYDPSGDLAGYNLIMDDGELAGKQSLLPLTVDRPIPGGSARPNEMMTKVLPHLYVQSTIDQAEAEAGQTFPLNLEWVATEGITRTAPSEAADLQLLWLDKEETIVATQTLPLADGYPITQWPLNQRLRTLHKFRVNNDLTAGVYTFSMSLSSKAMPDTALPMTAINLPITILASSRSFQLPIMETVLDAEFGGQIALRGIKNAFTLQSGVESATLELVWQALEIPDKDYSVTVQLLDETRVMSQVDLAMPGGSSNWLPDQVEVQQITLPTPGDSSKYQIIVALYDAAAEGFPRLTLPKGASHAIIR